MRFLAIAALMLTMGCAGRASYDSPPPEGPEPSPFIIDVAADPLSLAPGDTLLVRIRVQNASASTVLKRFPDGCQFGFRQGSSAANRFRSLSATRPAARNSCPPQSWRLGC